MLFGLMGNVSQVYGMDRSAAEMQMPVLQIKKWVKPVLNVLAYVAVILAILRWFVGFYFAIKFDYMHKINSMADDWMEFLSSCGQLLLFSLVCLFSASIN